MSAIELRKEFLEIIGQTYVQYGYPEYCGWIEGLMVLEPQDWTQQGISDRLGEVFPESKYPTSVPSVNRALKILETYGVVTKAGSRKTGYQYTVISPTNLIYSMLHQFLTLNQGFMAQMKDLSARSAKDSALKKAVNAELKAWRLWERAVKGMLETLGEK
ncbi:MAG: hypothetical protein ACW98Y_07755 [Candidatus Thorarchaeota archaeon]